MVRVGGGWVALDEFLVKNDPCRGECFVVQSIINSLLPMISISKQKNDHLMKYLPLILIILRLNVP